MKIVKMRKMRKTCSSTLQEKTNYPLLLVHYLISPLIYNNHSHNNKIIIKKLYKSSRLLSQSFATKIDRYFDIGYTPWQVPLFISYPLGQMHPSDCPSQAKWHELGHLSKGDTFFEADGIATKKEKNKDYDMFKATDEDWYMFLLQMLDFL